MAFLLQARGINLAAEPFEACEQATIGALLSRGTWRRVYWT